MSYFTPPRPRAVLAVSGDEAEAFLQGLITNDINRLGDDEILYAALLSAQGKILHTFFISKAPQGGYWLDILAQNTDDLMRRLRMFRLRAKVDIEDVSAQFMVALTLGKAAYSDPRTGTLGGRHIIPNTDETPAPAGTEIAEYDKARILACVPEQGMDFGMEEIFPADANMDLQQGVAFKKGCYVGQEVVSRMKRRGTTRKRFCAASFAGPAPEAGTLIMAGPARLGEIRSSAGCDAMALIRTDRLASAQQAGIEILADDTPLRLILPDSPEQAS